MTDINKQIEEEAREYDWQQELFNYMSNEHDILLLNSDMHEVYMICQKEFTHSSRWRKVSEELPEVNVNKTSKPVLIKTKYGAYDVVYYSYKYNDFIVGDKTIIGVIEWKPID